MWSVGSTVGSALLPVTWDDEDDYEAGAADSYAKEAEMAAASQKLTEDISTSIAFAIKVILIPGPHDTVSYRNIYKI